MDDLIERLREVLALSNKERDAEENREYGAANDLYADLQGAAVNLIRTHGPALLSALEDARRYRFLRDDAHTNRVPHIYQYPAQDFDKTKFPHFRDVGLDAAIDAAIAEGDQA